MNAHAQITAADFATANDAARTARRTQARAELRALQMERDGWAEAYRDHAEPENEYQRNEVDEDLAAIVEAAALIERAKARLLTLSRRLNYGNSEGLDPKAFVETVVDAMGMNPQGARVLWAELALAERGIG